jgi:hypothetical protein
MRDLREAVVFSGVCGLFADASATCGEQAPPVGREKQGPHPFLMGILLGSRGRVRLVTPLFWKMGKYGGV